MTGSGGAGKDSCCRHVMAGQASCLDIAHTIAHRCTLREHVFQALATCKPAAACTHRERRLAQRAGALHRDVASEVAAAAGEGAACVRGGREMALRNGMPGQRAANNAHAITLLETEHALRRQFPAADPASHSLGQELQSFSAMRRPLVAQKGNARRQAVQERSDSGPAAPQNMHSQRGSSAAAFSAVLHSFGRGCNAMRLQ